MDGAVNPNPADPEATPGHVAWTELVEAAGAARLRRADTAAAALATGELDLQALCRYAARNVASTERRELEGVLARSSWALGRVTALVRSARSGALGGIAQRTLSAARQGRIEPTRIASASLLQSLGRSDAEEVVTGGSPSDVDRLPAATPLVRAACLLGLGQRDAARDLFAELAAEEATAAPLTDLCRRLADLEDADDALAELLDLVDAESPEG